MNIEDLQRRLPTVFALAPVAMWLITPKIQMLAVDLDDRELTDGKIRPISNCSYQTMRQCEEFDVVASAQEQAKRGMVNKMLVTQPTTVQDERKTQNTLARGTK